MRERGGGGELPLPSAASNRPYDNKCQISSNCLPSTSEKAPDWSMLANALGTERARARSLARPPSPLITDYANLQNRPLIVLFDHYQMNALFYKLRREYVMSTYWYRHLLTKLVPRLMLCVQCTPSRFWSIIHVSGGRCLIQNAPELHAIIFSYLECTRVIGGR